MKHFVSRVSYLLIFVLVFEGCRKDTTVDPAIPNSELFVSATSLGTYPKLVLQGLATANGFGNYVSLIKNDVAFYKLVYKTTYKGNMINVSGLVALPQNISYTPTLVSAQHGTMFKASDAPSNFPGTFTGFELCAAAGFATIIPDYIGYGVSQSIAHPYYDQQYSGLTVVDMIKAAKYYLAKQNYAISDRLFILGYSEGGYVTMAAQKEIETNASNNINLTAAAEGAGGYDLTGMLSGIASTNTYAAPSFLALLVRGYDSTYNWNRPYSDFFQQPYADRIPSLLNGTKSREDIDAQLTTSPSALFNPVFYANLTNPTGETVFKQKLAANSFLTWVPKSPTRLFHGTADEAVYYQTSVDTYNRFKAAGATNVQFFPIQGGTHGTSIEPMMLNVLPWFQSLDK
jgi:pimeloyl-ACP methyl ester carboxylesterase